MRLRLLCRAVPLVTRLLIVVFVLINYALILGGNPYEGMTGEEVFNFVASGQRMYRTSAMSSELYVYSYCTILLLLENIQDTTFYDFKL